MRFELIQTAWKAVNLPLINTHMDLTIKNVRLEIIRFELIFRACKTHTLPIELYSQIYFLKLLIA